MLAAVDEGDLALDAVAKDASLADLKTLFGPCTEVPVKGCAFYNCTTGGTIGTDFAQQGQFIQLRLKSR